MQNDIDYIIDTFDFNKVLLVMNMLDWTWASGPVTIQGLKSTARKLLYQMEKSKEKNDNISTGGLCVQKYGRHLILKFVLEEQSNEALFEVKNG